MAVTRNNLSMKMKGRVGAYTFYTTNGGRQVARIANNGSNYGDTAKRTVAMQTRRTKWGNLVSFYRANRDLMARAFERKDANISDYNRFMQLNIPNARVALTKDAFMRGVTILQEYVVADGSLPEITCVVEEAGDIIWDLNTSIDGEFADHTVGELSADLLAKNPGLQKGDQLTFINWTNAPNVDSMPRLYRKIFELTIDPESSTSCSRLPNSETVAGSGGKTHILGFGQVYGQSIIHSRVQNGNLLVSRANITLSDDTYVRQFSDSEAVKKAIDSYGVDVEKLLEPGSPEQPAPKPMPSLKMISSIVRPNGCGTLIITDNVTGAVYRNSASLPVGTYVSISVEESEGFSVSIEPSLADPENYEVVGDITFVLAGSPKA